MKSIYAKVSAVMLVSTLFLSGCGNAVTYMTSEQSELIGEYAATLLLKYDANHESRLVDLSTIEETPTVEELKATPVEEQKQEEKNDTPVIEKEDGTGKGNAMGSVENIADVCAFPEGVEITYKEYELTDAYNDEEFEYFALEASEGKQLLVMTFELKNTTGENQDVDILTQNVKMKVTVNEDYSRYALTTMLMNDLATYQDVLTPDEVAEVVLIIEVDDSMEEDIHSITLNLQNASNAHTIPLF